MQRRSATTGLIATASRVLRETVGVLSDPERGTVSVSGEALGAPTPRDLKSARGSKNK